ncbi:hypothetical protein [Providencia sp.]|uniref:hypothetical protein n=1 Tax=Providencia sp. TaxID=589 RepID=UPI003F971A48
MKTIGYILVITGVIFLGFSFLMDTAVYVNELGKVNNLPLLFSQQNKIIVCCFVILYGIIFITNGRKSDNIKEIIEKNDINEIKDIGFKSTVISNINNYRSYDFFKNGKLDENRLSGFLVLCNTLINEAKNNKISMDKIDIIMNDIIYNITDGLNKSDSSRIKIEIKKLTQ